MTIVYRDVKGANLTPNEVDGNFHDLDDRVTDIEENPPEARSIAEITQSGDGGSLTVEYTDSTTDGPFALPQFSIRFRGEWVALTGYIVNDIFTAQGNVYIVLFAHTSEATFDPGANNGMGDDYYGVLLAMPELSIPAGGGEGFVLTKASNSDYDFEWQARGLPEGGSAGYILTKATSDDFDVEWTAAAAAPVLVVSSSEFNPTTSFAGGFFVCTNASGCLVRIPENSSEAFPVGSELHFLQDTPAGSVVIAGQDSDTSVTVDAPVGFEPLTDIEGAVITVKKLSTNRWVVFGLLAAENPSDTA